MAAFQHLVRRLRQAERELERQLEGIRAAISSLEFGGGGVPRSERIKRPASRRPRPKRKMSAKARRAISLAQKRRWAKKKAGA